MDRDRQDPIDLDSFWEQADAEDSAEHPLERELCDHLDALVRYRRLIDDALADGRDDAVDLLLRNHEREERAVRRLRDALERLRDRPAARPPRPERRRADPLRPGEAPRHPSPGTPPPGD